jgi:hypothetical protein
MIGCTQRGNFHKRHILSTVTTLIWDLGVVWAQVRVITLTSRPQRALTKIRRPDGSFNRKTARETFKSKPFAFRSFVSRP